MKKILFVISVISVLLLTGCNKNETIEDNSSPEITVPQQQEEIIKEDANIGKVSFNTNGEPFVKLSDSYYLNSDILTEMPKEEIMPSKIILVNPSILDKYSLQIPVEKCDSYEEEKIIYEKYGIEKRLIDGVVEIGNIEIHTDYYEGEPAAEQFSNYTHKYIDDLGPALVSLTKEAVTLDMNSGAYSTYNLYDLVGHIYESDLDENKETKEIFICSIERSTSDFYSFSTLVKYNEENGNAEKLGRLFFNENIYQIGNYKNVILSGINYSDIGNYFSNLIVGYYVYDKDLGLLEVEKLANGESLSNIDIGSLDNCILKEDMSFGSVSDQNSQENEYSYSTWGYDDNSEIVTLKKGTKLKIIKILDNHGNFIAATEDGTRYGFINYAGRT